MSARCTCDPVPMTAGGEGPSETCELHGRSYHEWVERGDILNARLVAVKEVITKVRRTPAVNDPYRVALDIADDLESAVYLEPGTWPPDHGKVLDEGWASYAAEQERHAETAAARDAHFDARNRLAEKVDRLEARLAQLGDAPPPPEPAECCASGRCEVCPPGYDWRRDG